MLLQTGQSQQHLHCTEGWSGQGGHSHCIEPTASYADSKRCRHAPSCSRTGSAGWEVRVCSGALSPPEAASSRGASRGSKAKHLHSVSHMLAVCTGLCSSAAAACCGEVACMRQEQDFERGMTWLPQLGIGSAMTGSRILIAASSDCADRQLHAMPGQMINCLLGAADAQRKSW